MANIIVGAIILLIVIGVIAYIVKEKKRGAKCIGCSSGGCSHSTQSAKNNSDSCNCK